MPNTKAVPSLLRRLNERTVLETILSAAPISRAELARRTGISKPTVSLALRALLEDGIVRETSRGRGGPHYGAVYYEADPEAALVLGIDLSSRALRVAVSDLAGDLRARQDIQATGAAPERIRPLGGVVRSLLQASGLSPALIDRVVVGVPAIVSPADGKVYSSDLPGLDAPDLSAELQRQLGVTVTLENDVNLAALAELHNGTARGVKDFAFLLVGDGLGAAVVLDGRIHRGSHGAAGELDAVRSGRPDDVDPCESALLAYAATLAAAEPTILRAPFEARDLFTAARAGDAVGLAVAAEAARRIALHIVPLAATLDLPLVVIGGDVGGQADLLLGPIRLHLEEWLEFPPRVEVSAHGGAAVLDGALAAALDAMLEHILERRPTARTVKPGAHRPAR
jgi:predicted NBD/HSP70 family sugar kinase